MTAEAGPGPGAGPDGAPPPALLARGLGKRYGALVALHGLDLAVRRGECVLLLGPNGAGKSTLLGIFATIIRPNEGRIAIFGASPREGDPAALRRRIGLLSHQTFLYDHLTAFENLRFYARLYSLPDPDRAAASALRSARLLERAHDLVRTYSRGMQQRLAIARALLHAPDILLLDEPFSGLDRESIDRLQECLREERRAGRTCLLATHDFAAARPLADRVVVLRAGRLVADRQARGLDDASLEGLFRDATLPPATGAQAP
ncbi:MAG: sodium ABC transporter ATP-binding protein [Acidobacteria bacterium]|nr:MAG: sodium ABC transporter ATP-binding protein [Acidobacteriota bacterium]